MTVSGPGVALARAALAGNPSDLYGGAVLAVTLDDFSAQAAVSAASTLEVDPPSRLVEATARRFGRQLHPGAAQVEIRWRSSIPRMVGLGGSSALVIATARALCQHCGLALDPAELAEFALAVETEDLGITAGPQDRLAQAHEGLTYMDFTHRQASCQVLDRALLPPLLIAWRLEPGGASGDVHARTRDVSHTATAALAQAARAARDALVAGNQAGFAAAVDQTLELRGALMELDPPSLDMARVARSCGAGANFTGSGGAIVAIGTAEQLQCASHELRKLGYGALLSR